ncbi:MAG: MBL fold metallo-hydrolase [Armatimonadetes bacterium]|nr:MBL fold metallo-hydrolase [Armatimonadota bacterium]
MLVPEIMQFGDALINDIDGTEVKGGRVAIWWLGQNSFAIKCANAIVYTDPYLSSSPHRLIPPPLNPEEIKNADIVTCSHDHSDHIDPLTIPHIAAASTKAKFIIPRAAMGRLLKLGVSEDRLIPMNDGDEVELHGVRIWAVKARHERFDEHPEHGFPYLSYLFDMLGVRIYHAGDGKPYEGLVSTLRGYMPAIMLMPINGRDGERYRRNCIGNFTFQEAGDIAADVRAKLVIPMHWGMFADNNEDASKFVDYVTARYTDLRVKVLAIGERLLFP